MTPKKASEVLKEMQSYLKDLGRLDEVEALTLAIRVMNKLEPAILKEIICKGAKDNPYNVVISYDYLAQAIMRELTSEEER